MAYLKFNNDDFIIYDNTFIIELVFNYSLTNSSL